MALWLRSGPDLAWRREQCRPATLLRPTNICRSSASCERFSLAGDHTRVRGERFDRGRARRLRNMADLVSLDCDDGVTARLHRPLQPFDGFVDPLIVVL